MNKNFFAIPMLILLICVTVYSQSDPLNLNFNMDKNAYGNSLLTPLNITYSKAGAPLSFYIAAIINPMLVIEDKKVFFGLTKEVSIGKFPYGRLAFEYSYIFRSYNTSHLRLSYNYDIILDIGQFVGFVATPGVGYFTDTKNNGWFIHGSFGAILPTGNYFAFNPYLRYRHTFIKDISKSNINDVSLGVGLMFYY